jgi:hypothetical protein
MYPATEYDWLTTFRRMSTLRFPCCALPTQGGETLFVILFHRAECFPRSVVSGYYPRAPINHQTLLICRAGVHTHAAL